MYTERRSLLSYILWQHIIRKVMKRVLPSTQQSREISLDTISIDICYNLYGKMHIIETTVVFMNYPSSAVDRRYLPLFMSLTTMLGVIPFLALLDDASYDRAGFKPCFYAFAGGCLASMPSVNVRPCIINVNAPECRGTALTAANLIINAARGAGPSFLTTVLMGCFGLNRASGFNIMVSALTLMWSSFVSSFIISTSHLFYLDI